MKTFSLAMLGLTLSLPAWAAITPVPAGDDPHVQTVAYNPDEVITIKTRIGVATLIQFGADENIVDQGLVAVGDTNAWKIASNRNIIIVKPRQSNPDTNFTVVTDKRTYVLNLT